MKTLLGYSHALMVESYHLLVQLSMQELEVLPHSLPWKPVHINRWSVGSLTLTFSKWMASFENHCNELHVSQERAKEQEWRWWAGHFCYQTSALKHRKVFSSTLSCISFSRDGINACAAMGEKSIFKFWEKSHKKGG